MYQTQVTPLEAVILNALVTESATLNLKVHVKTLCFTLYADYDYFVDCHRNNVWLQKYPYLNMEEYSLSPCNSQFSSIYTSPPPPHHHHDPVPLKNIKFPPCYGWIHVHIFSKTYSVTQC